MMMSILLHLNTNCGHELKKIYQIYKQNKEIKI